MTVDRQSYFICTIPRSGSTLLCHLLADTRRAGNPNSHFHEPSLEAWCSYYNISRNDFPNDQSCRQEIFRAALKLGRGTSNVFGQRLQQESFAFFLRQLSAQYPDLETDTARIEATFGRTLFIHLTRYTKLDQAISLEIALQSGLWHRRGDGTELERQSPHQTPTYNATALRTHIAVAQTKEQAWRDWFRQQNITPLHVSYEALSKNPFEIRDQILTALDVALDDASNGQTPTAKLANDTSIQWALQFRKDHPDLVTPEMSAAF